MSNITDFYTNNGSDNKGRRLFHVLGLSNYQLEHSHDLVQWLFPTTEKSAFNSDAPVLTEEDVSVFQEDKVMRENLRRSYHRFLNLLGPKEEEGKVVRGENFQERYGDCWSAWNHNFLRITRAISSLRTLGLMQEAWRLYEGVLDIARTEGFGTFDHTFLYWKAAVTGQPFPKFGG